MHDELHAACFANPVLFVAMLPKVAPFPITALEPVLIKEAHVLN